MAISRRLVRPLLSSSFLVTGTQVLKDPTPAAEGLRPFVDRVVPTLRARGLPVPQDPTTLARGLAGVQVAAAGALALGRAPRLSALVLTTSMLPALMANAPSGSDDSATRQRNVAETAKNASLLGGAFLAALDTEGRPGFAWRARRATRDARRQARHLAKETRLEAKLATKSLT